MYTRGITIELWHAIIHIAKSTEFRSFERINRSRVGFRDITSAIDLVIQDNQNTMASCFRIGSNTNCIQKVHWTICADCRSRTHCTRNNYWFIALDGQVQEICRFLKRIRTVRDDDTIDIAAG